MTFGVLEIGLLMCVLMTFVAFAMLLGGTSGGPSKKKGNIVTRVERLSHLSEELRAEIPDSPVEVQEDKSLLGKVDLRSTLGKFTGEALFNGIEKDLARADIPLRVAEALAIWVVFILFVFAVTLFFTSGNLLISILAALPAAFIHIPILSWRKKARVDKFSNQLAEFLILVVNSLRAGQTFMQGSEVAAKESPEPIAGEFLQVLKEVNLGIPVETSMDNMLERVPSEDLKIVVAAYTIQRKVGGNLATIFETTAGTIRERIRIKGQINTLTTQGKLSGVVVGVVPFVIVGLMTFMEPDMMFSFWEATAGKIAVGFALLLQGIGAFAIKKIVDIEV